jgi:hypothetical protein
MKNQMTSADCIDRFPTTDTPCDRPETPARTDRAFVPDSAAAAFTRDELRQMVLELMG